MPFSLVPDQVLDRYTDVTAPMLQALGVRLLLCDLDYTLAPRSVREPDRTLTDWLSELEAAGIEVVILSNNRSSRRVETFCSQLGIRYVGRAGKPSSRGYREAMALAGAPPGETAMLGDKLLTDGLGARRSGVRALIVEPLGGPVGSWNRFLHLLQEPFKQISKRRYRNHEQI